MQRRVAPDGGLRAEHRVRRWYHRRRPSARSRRRSAAGESPWTIRRPDRHPDRAAHRRPRAVSARSCWRPATPAMRAGPRRTSTWPRPSSRRSPARSGGSRRSARCAIVVVILAGLLAVIGTALFLGEWLLGSLGWGVLHGILAFTGIAVAAGLLALGVGGDRIGSLARGRCRSWPSWWRRARVRVAEPGLRARPANRHASTSSRASGRSWSGCSSGPSSASCSVSSRPSGAGIAAPASAAILGWRSSAPLVGAVRQSPSDHRSAPPSGSRSATSPGSC